MDITAWMVIKDDEYYVDMAVKAILPYVSAIYVQDQKSKDNSVDIIGESVANRIPYWIETVDTGLERFDPTYNEPHYRNLALKRAKELFKSDWLLQFDADDYYTPYFFKRLKELEDSGELAPYNSIRQSSERFVTPEYRAQRGANSLGIHQIINGEAFLDPHTRLWRSNLGCEYVENPAFKDSEMHFLHCVLHPEPMPMYWLSGMCVIHLHRMFGPKAWAFWEEGGDKFDKITPFNPRRLAPKWFYDMVNMGDAVYTDYDWPDFVMNKWKEWGVYD